MVTPEALVAREVHYCVSALVATLANVAYDGELASATQRRAMLDLCEQAAELCASTEDWEGAALEAGWRHTETSWRLFQHADTDEVSPVFASASNPTEALRELCEHYDIEPNYPEVYEHWLVSDWLADKLEARGEKVDKDFAGMTVWARTTTGQAIYADSVIEAICAELNRPEPHKTPREALVEELSAIIAPHLYPSGYVTALDKSKGVLGGTRPVMLWAPLGADGTPTMEPITLDGYVLTEFEGLTEFGPMTDSVAGAMAWTGYDALPMEDLQALRDWARSYFK